MIKPSDFRSVLVDMTGKRIPTMPEWRSQTSPTLEVSLMELVKLANDCRESASMLEDFADYVDRLWEIRSVEEEDLCDTCTKAFSTCNGSRIVWGIDVDPTSEGTPFADKVLKCDVYRCKS